MSGINVRRAFLATALYITSTAVVTATVVALIAGVRDVPLGTAFENASARALYPRPRLVIGVLAAFLAGWWGARGLPRRRLEQGMLIGIFVGVAATLLAYLDHELRGRAVAIMLQISAAIAGSALTLLDPPIRRAFIAAGVQVVATIVLLMTLALLTVSPLGGGRGQISGDDVEHFQAFTPWLSQLVRATTAFLAGWWGARGLTSGFIKQGVLIGVLIAAITVLWVPLLGRLPSVWVFVYSVPAMAASVAGAAFARDRSGSNPV